MLLPFSNLHGLGADKKPESLSGSFILPPDATTRRQTHGMGIGKGGREGGWAEVFAACAKLMTPPPETAAIFFAKSPKGERDAKGDKAPPLSLPPFLASRRCLARHC